jgi:hypothetical protein
MRRVSAAPLLGFALFGCSGASPAATTRARDAVLLLDIEAGPGRLDPALAAALTAHISRVVAASETYRVIAGQELRDALRAQRSQARRKRHGARAKHGRGSACSDLPCQARAGQALGAVAAIVMRVERNLLGECDVFAELRDLRRVSTEGKARARRACGAEELKDSLHDVLCHVLAQRGARRSDAGAPSPAAPDPAQFTDCLARADFHWAEHRLEEFRGAKVDRSPEALATQEQKMGEQVLGLKRLYDGVGQHRRPRWTIAAQCRTGAIYEAFAARLLESYRTEGAGSSEMTGAAREKARPLEDKAREIYAACVKRGEQLKISCPELDEARRRASAR